MVGEAGPVSPADGKVPLHRYVAQGRRLTRPRAARDQESGRGGGRAHRARHHRGFGGRGARVPRVPAPPPAGGRRARGEMQVEVVVRRKKGKVEEEEEEPELRPQ